MRNSLCTLSTGNLFPKYQEKVEVLIIIRVWRSTLVLLTLGVFGVAFLRLPCAGVSLWIRLSHKSDEGVCYYGLCTKRATETVRYTSYNTSASRHYCASHVGDAPVSITGGDEGFGCVGVLVVVLTAALAIPGGLVLATVLAWWPDKSRTAVWWQWWIGLLAMLIFADFGLWVITIFVT